MMRSNGARQRSRRKLRSRRGDRVGVLAHKSVDTVVALWAAMRTGAVYVPLDPTAPAARVAHIACDCGMTSLLASDSLSNQSRPSGPRSRTCRS